MPRSRALALAVLLGLKVLLARGLVFGVGGVLQPGALVDVAAVVLLVCLAESLPRRAAAGAEVLLDLVLSVVLVAVAMYAHYFGGIPSPASVLLLREVVSLPEAVFRSVQPGHVVLVADVLLLVAILKLDPPSGARARRRLALVAAVSGALFSVGIAADVLDAGSSYSAGALRHGLFATELARSAVAVGHARAAVDVRDAFTLQQLIDRLKGAEAAPTALEGHARGKNLIIVQVESLQAFPLGRKVDGRSLTPFLDRLSAEDISFTSAFTQVSRGNTSDAEYVVNTSLYPQYALAVAYAYGDKRFPSLPRLLSEAGYDTMTFHANSLTYWNRRKLYEALGFGKAYDAAFFGKEDVVGPGVSDEAFFRKVLPVLEAERRSGKPFYAQLVTLTTHYPFDLPPEKQRLTLPQAFDGSLVGRYLQAVAYEDAALERFVGELRRTGLWDESVVVIYGDHAGLPVRLSGQERALLSEVLGREYTEADRLNVPLIVHVPGAQRTRPVDGPVGQVDVLPTMASVLGVPLGPQVHFGRNALAPGTELLGIRWYEDLTWADGRVLVRTGGPDALGGVYDARTKERLPEPVPGGDADRVRQLEELSDSYVDTLPRR